MSRLKAAWRVLRHGSIPDFGERPQIHQKVFINGGLHIVTSIMSQFSLHEIGKVELTLVPQAAFLESRTYKKEDL